MSEFSDAFAETWDAAVAVFGDRCTLMGVEYDCIIHTFDATTEVRRGAPGVSQVADGSVIMRESDWAVSGARKGSRITLGDREYRIINDPAPGYASSTVSLTIAPLV